MSKLTRNISLTTFLAASMALSANAQQSAPAKPAAAKQPAAAKPAPARPAGGLKAYIDPVTKELRPKEHDDVSPGLSIASVPAAPVEIQTAGDGSKSAVLNGRFRMSAVAVRKPDGTIVYDCVPAGQPIPSSRPAKKEALDVQ